MASGVAVWGIDIGRCALKAMKLRAAGDGRVEVVGQEYIEHSTILTRAEGKQHALVAEALEKFLSNNDISKDKIVVGVPGQHTLARFSKLPPVEAKKIPDIVRYEADQQIPFDLDEVIWDYQTFQEEDSPDVEVGIFAMKRELIHDYLLPLQQAGIEPIAVQSAPLALYNAMHFEQRLGDDTTVLLDVGAENTDLIVATRFGLWTRTIPLGGNKFTEALVKSFKLSFFKAEKLKRTAATSKYARQVFQAMRPVFAELVQELSRSLGFYRSGHREAELKRIVGMGNAFRLPGLQKYLQQNLQLPVEKPTVLKQADVADAAALKEQLPSFMVSYGLALQGLEAAQAQTGTSAIKSNLLPPEIVKQVVWRKKRPYFAAAAACLAAAACIVWFRQSSDLRTLAANAGEPVGKITFVRATDLLSRGVSGVPARQEAQTWLDVAKALQAELKKYSSLGSDEEEKSEQIVALQRNKAVWPRILAAIHEALPTPRSPLAEARDAEEFRAAIENDKTGALARKNRRQVFIERFSAKYEEDVTKIDLLDIVLQDNIPDVLDAPEEKRDGFLVTLQCRTPNGGKIKFVDNFKAELRRQGRKPNQGFFINRVVLTAGRGFTERADDPPPGGGRGGRGRRGRGRSKPKKSQPNAVTYDPVTDESMNDDWVFELKFDVLLTDLPGASESEGDE